MGTCSFDKMEEKKPYFAVILIQLIYAGMFLFSKAAFNAGMNTFVFVFYRQAAATLFLLPVAIIFERKKAPSLSFKLFCKIFMISLCGVALSLNINCVALIYTSATLGAATINTLPVITFFLAVLLRVETVNLRTLSGNVKLIGVTLCMVGAVTLAFYKGPHMKLLIHDSFSKSHIQKDQVLSTTNKTWIKGVFLMLISNTLWGFWLVLQGRILISYPSKLLFTTLTCILSTLQSFVIAIAIETNLSHWKLRWDVGLLAVVYCGVVVTGVTFYLQAWCIENKGPVFLAMSTPLALIITILFSAVFLGDIISLGSVLGGILLVGGLYFVLWGKNKEMTTPENEKDCSEEIEIA
ncbi:hypothetical protein NE237_016236 [Protea cynaroides]|uniref:WAT1-related protein n=1 Tax=Protea cynaroides TaxID=273540 RepID=A0A9Q0QRP4_9MAGN|nr:hypothetical protein NE237_016236 [Protea cynaroides]